MPRKKLIRQSDYPYHITSRCNNHDWFKAPMDAIWEFFIFSIKRARQKTDFKIHCYVLMNNHYHIILTTPHANIDQVMFYINKTFSDLIRQRTSQKNHKFKGRYCWSIISSQNYLYNCYRYVLQNPVRAGIIQKCENYPYSSIYKMITVDYVHWGLNEVPHELREFFNREISKDLAEATKRGLRAPLFGVSKRESVVIHLEGNARGLK